MIDPVSTQEIADRLNVQANTVHMWRQRDLGFPEPDWVLSSTPVWLWETVRVWAEATGRL